MANRMPAAKSRQDAIRPRRAALECPMRSGVSGKLRARTGRVRRAAMAVGRNPGTGHEQLICTLL